MEEGGEGGRGEQEAMKELAKMQRTVAADGASSSAAGLLRRPAYVLVEVWQSLPPDLQAYTADSNRRDRETGCGRKRKEEEEAKWACRSGGR